MKAYLSSPRARLLAHAAFPLAVCLLLISPMILTGRSFGPDWTNHLWLVNVQGRAISGGGPTLNLHTDYLGVFYPFFTFYGGTLYTIGGAISAALGGQPIVAYVLMWIFGFLIAYGGMLWLSFQAGLSGWQAHAAPLVLITSAYYLTNAYARGAWPELMAVSAIPLVLASAVWILRAPEMKFWPGAAMFVAALMFTGSHNITLLWGTMTIGALMVIAVVAVPSFRSVQRRRVWFIVGLGALGVAINAWFLLPDIVYTGKTIAAAPGRGFLFDVSDVFTGPGNVFSPLRHAPAASTTGNLDAQLPVLVLLWAIVVGVLCLRRGFEPRLRKIAVGLTTLIVILVGLLMFGKPWQHLPHLLTLIQFSYRLESYIVILLALLVVVLLKALAVWGDRSPDLARGLKAALALVLVIGFGQAFAQAWGTQSFTVLARGDTIGNPHKLPRNWFPAGDYRDASARAIGGKLGYLSIDPNLVNGNKVVVRTPKAGATVATNIAGGPYVAKVSGAKSDGRTEDGSRVITPVATAGDSATVTVTAAKTWPFVLGRWITFIALAIAAGVALFCAYTTLVARRRSTGPRR